MIKDKKSKLQADVLTKDMLPISRDYALSLIDAFLVHHVLGLAVEADKMAGQS